MPDATDTLDALYRRHAPSVFRRAHRLLGHEAEAREVVQDVFLSLFERPDQYAGRSALTTFLYSAATHACLNRIRDQKTRARLLQERFAARTDDEPDRGLSPEQLSALHDALSRMPEELARVAVYYCVDDLTHDDIARLMGCSRRQIGNLLDRVTEWGKTLEGETC